MKIDFTKPENKLKITYQSSTPNVDMEIDLSKFFVVDGSGTKLSLNDLILSVLVNLDDLNRQSST